jgi:hypothetical protein
MNLLNDRDPASLIGQHNECSAAPRERRQHRAGITPQEVARYDNRRCPGIGKETTMPKYVIEREIPGAGSLSPDKLQATAQKSCAVLRDLGPQIQWVQSYVTDDKLYCVYISPDEETIREHARRGDFPVNRISRVARVIDPTTSET